MKCRKTEYRSQAFAELAIMRLPGHEGCHVYHCRHCGWWHIGHPHKITPEEKRAMREHRMEART